MQTFFEKSWKILTFFEKSWNIWNKNGIYIFKKHRTTKKQKNKKKGHAQD